MVAPFIIPSVTNPWYPNWLLFFFFFFFCLCIIFPFSPLLYFCFQSCFGFGFWVRIVGAGCLGTPPGPEFGVVLAMFYLLSPAENPPVICSIYIKNKQILLLSLTNLNHPDSRISSPIQLEVLYCMWHVFGLSVLVLLIGICAILEQKYCMVQEWSWLWFCVLYCRIFCSFCWGRFL